MTPYIPESLPLAELDLDRLVSLVGRANAALARYDGLLQSIPNAEVMLSPLTTREAVLSSKIEGTQVTVDDVLSQDAGILQVGSKHTDALEVQNYRRALLLSKETLRDRPLILSVIRQLHEILLDSVRGDSKFPGEFRRVQNWIGPRGCTIETATFVPPAPLQLLDHMEQWADYIAYDDKDVLIQTAIVHAQFELLHPFMDGNGRIGRLLIPLFLFHKNMLSEPMFYLSEYLERHRRIYYARLSAISSDRDWDGWVEFFLEAVIAQAEENSARAKSIQALYDEMKGRIQEITRSQYSVYLLDAIFEQPIFSTSDIAARLNQRFNIHEKTTASLVRQLRDASILAERRPSAGRRPAVFSFPALIDRAEGRAPADATCG